MATNSPDLNPRPTSLVTFLLPATPAFPWNLGFGLRSHDLGSGNLDLGLDLGILALALEVMTLAVAISTLALISEFWRWP